MKVVQQNNGLWSVMAEQNEVLCSDCSNSEAWRFVDKLTGSPKSRSEDVSEWILKKEVARDYD